MEQPTVLNQPPVEQLSFMDKAAGVFYEPSKVFESFKTSPAKAGDWLVPVLLLAILIGVSTYVRFSSPDLRFQMAQQQEQRFDKMVAQGRMTAEQAQQATERMENGSSVTMAFGVFGAVVATFIIFFAAAAVWLFIGKVILKGNVNYSKMMGVAGISSWIMVVGTILSIVVTVLASRLDGGLHLGMLMQMSTSNKIYSLARSADLFTIWNLTVTSVGVGALSSKKGIQPTIWVFGIWIILVLISVFVLGGMFGG